MPQSKDQNPMVDLKEEHPNGGKMTKNDTFPHQTGEAPVFDYIW